ncbi:glycosyltransferase [Pseudorhodobacter sp. E13]|uniref:glycosyltransferase n=1 Tax=Pseudorhodobacter sp. E13 TaxID=2487931 RepID=UPI001315812D|nr:glycosyltransferase [Pseudorhodobacter sp. E13]
MIKANTTKRRAIVCAISADHAFALGSLIAGFARHNPGFEGVFVVFHDGLDADQQAQLRALWPDIAFRPFTPADLAARFGAGTDISAALALYSPMIFAKFELPNLLAEFEKCLWLDVDILIQGDLGPIWAFDALAWRPLPEGAFARRAEVMERFADLRGDGSYPLLNGGVLGMGPGVRGQLSTDDLYAMAARLMAQTGAHSVDELAVYFCAAAGGVPLHLLDQRFNHPIIAAGCREAVVLHAIGPDKFWNSAPLQLAYPEWARNLAEWQAVGGAGFAGPMRLAEVQAATPDQALKAARHRAYWHALYDGLRAALPPRLTVDLRANGPGLRFFIQGLPDTVHLRLTRQTNERRIGLHLCFQKDAPHAQAIFARLDGLALAATKGKPLELAQTRHGLTYGTVLPVAACAEAMAQIMDALRDL